MVGNMVNSLALGGPKSREWDRVTQERAMERTQIADSVKGHLSGLAHISNAMPQPEKSFTMRGRYYI